MRADFAHAVGHEDDGQGGPALPDVPRPRLSRITYAADSWYPFITEANRERLRQLHCRGCCLITGCPPTSHATSVMYEAGFRTRDEVIRDHFFALADKLRRISDGCASADKPEACFGLQWVVRLFRDARCPPQSCAPCVPRTAASVGASRPLSAGELRPRG
jgi:hypothetical protein